MNRINAIEIHEQPWFPKTIRDGVTDALQSVLSVAGVYQPVVSHLAKALNSVGRQRNGRRGLALLSECLIGSQKNAYRE